MIKYNITFNFCNKIYHLTSMCYNKFSHILYLKKVYFIFHSCLMIYYLLSHVSFRSHILCLISVSYNNITCLTITLSRHILSKFSLNMICFTISMKLSKTKFECLFPKQIIFHASKRVLKVLGSFNFLECGNSVPYHILLLASVSNT